MKIVLVSRRYSRAHTISLSKATIALLSLCFVGMPMGLGYLTFYMSAEQAAVQADKDALIALQGELNEQREELSEVERNARDKLAAMTIKLAEMQAQMLRLDALGERLTDMADMDDGEFDFSQKPAFGGPELALQEFNDNETTVFNAIEHLSSKVDSKGKQLEVLESLLSNSKIKNDVSLTGRPIVKGWLSSKYGYRVDPFNGNKAWHGGVDFAGKFGSDVVTVGSGVVTWSGDRYGYGQMVEVNHGNGYVSRYAHNSENFVVPGEIVKKGQVIAAMGSSGRSTGPHVHFEVYKHGRTVDPATYIHRTHR
jgi:murein DD-endopeptidase MepM/ murein hydrolase activator NlpD